ncbi:MAG: alpha/beta hydrolase [Leptolyngbya sp. PLA3]|nr:MAG: alpha/beta hydrolase [Cyanobacteria bacterium CYA]MCE7969266.1 alpha/beta hydrolase [Leptolyngbya sp. PL-A3]
MHLLGLVTLLALAGLIYLAMLVALLAWGLTHPPRRTYSSAVARGGPGSPDELDPPLRCEEWTFLSRGRTLSAWDVRGRDSSGPTVIFTHGWGDSRIGALPRMAALAPLASRMVAWDLPGHGEAPGLCRLGRHEVADLLALMERVGGPVVLFGWSLGAGLCLEAGPDPRIVAIVAEAPYRFQDASARNVLRGASLPSGRTLDLALLVLGMKGRWKARSDRAALASRIACPVLVLHGTEDEVCPIDDARAIARAAMRATLVEIDGGDHNHLWTEPTWARQCSDAVRAFLPDTASPVAGR